MASCLLIFAATLATAAAQLTFDLDTVNPTPYKLLAPYLNFNIDTGSIYNGFDFNNPVLINLVYALNPLNSDGGVIVRVGGTAADYAYYVPGSSNTNGGNGHTIYSEATLEALWQFAGQAHATVMFDFNGLTFRNTSGGAFGPWDPEGNATAILGYLNASHPGQAKWAWSVGNEPDFWPTTTKNYTQLGVDSVNLEKLIRANYSGLGSTVYGPSFGGLDAAYVAEYMQGIGGYTSGITVHSYPLARDCNISSYLNAKAPVADMGRHLADVAATRNGINKNTPLILEETAGSFDGGCENITDRFLDGFFWLDTLGTVATSGFQRVHRQDIAGWSFTGGMSHYQLAGPPGWTNGSAALTPHPDWYTSVLFKSIVGNTVLNGTLSGDPSLTSVVSAYAWCNGMPWWFNQSWVMTFTNPTGNDVSIDITGVNLTAAPRTEYILTSDASTYSESRRRQADGRLITTTSGLAPLDPPASITADEVYLNGALWQVDDNGILPALPVVGNQVNDPTQQLILPPYSYGFIQYPGASPLSCK